MVWMKCTPTVSFMLNQWISFSNYFTDHVLQFDQNITPLACLETDYFKVELAIELRYSK